MGQTEADTFIIGPDDLILITGATGFIGRRVVRQLLDYGYRNLRCLVRPSADASRTKGLSALGRDGAHVEIISGNLLRREDCAAAAKDVAVVYHLAAGRGEKSYPDAFLNSVVTTRNRRRLWLCSPCSRITRATRLWLTWRPRAWLISVVIRRRP